MEFKSYRVPGGHLLASEAARKVLKAAEGGKYIELNLEEAVDTDSTAIKLLIRLYKIINQKNGEIRLVNVSHRILTVLEACRLDRIMYIDPFWRSDERIPN